MADPSFVPVLLALPSLTPSLALEVLPHGLTFNRLYVQADGRTHDLLVGPENPTDHLRQKYTNTVVGRYANRLPVSSHTLAKGGVEATFAPRPNEAPTVSLHGGVQGWDSHFWEPVLSPYDAKLFTPAEVATMESELAGQTSVIFRRYSEDGEEGFPGRLLCEVFVALVPPKGVAQEEEHCLGSVVVIYRAQLEEANKVTPINLTQHWGFNLDASLQKGEPTVKDHHIDIKAKHTVALDATALATGELLPVTGTHHDHSSKPSFTAGKGSLIGESFDNGYDEFYVFEKPSNAIPTRLPASALSKDGDASATDPVKNTLKSILSVSPRTLRESAPVSLSSDKSGLSLVFASNQSGVQFYTNNLTAPSKNARKRIHGGTGAFGEGGYGVGSAAFLEFHAPLAAFLYPALKAASLDEDTLLASGEVYNNFVRADVWFKARRDEE